MIHHLSLAAREPERAARVVAELWGGQAFPFSPVGHGSWVAVSGDDRGSTMEIYAAGTELKPANGDADSAVEVRPDPARYTATHALIATGLDEAQVHAIADREGWICKRRTRPAGFTVIEFWIEDSVLLEVATPAMQREYLDFMRTRAPAFLAQSSAA